MKREEVREIFPEATDEQVDAILNKNGSEINPLRSRLKTAESERDDARAALTAAQASEASVRQQLDEANAAIQAGMSDEERIAAREKAAEDREREFTLKSNGLDAKGIFVGAGCFEADEIEELVEQVVTADPEQTKARAQRIVDTVSRQREAVAKETQDALLKDNPHLGGGDGGDGGAPTTKKEFMGLPYDQQLAAMEANPQILSQLK
jgi:hypothetical protein